MAPHQANHPGRIYEEQETKTELKGAKNVMELRSGRMDVWRVPGRRAVACSMF
jgi:hypothetical protein